VVIIETLVEANGRFIFGEPKTQRSRRTVPLPRRVVVELDNHLQRCLSGQAARRLRSPLIVMGISMRTPPPTSQTAWMRSWARATPQMFPKSVKAIPDSIRHGP